VFGHIHINITWYSVSNYWMTLRTGEDTLIWRGSCRSHYVEESLWRRLWTCRQTEYWMNEFCQHKHSQYRHQFLLHYKGILRRVPSTHTNGTQPKTNGKVVPVHAMKAYRQSRGIAPHILSSSSRVRWEVNFMPWPISPWKVHRYPWYRRLGWPRAGPGRFGKDEDLLHLLGSEPQTFQPVAFYTDWAIPVSIYVIIILWYPKFHIKEYKNWMSN
jgi:hypothetical protein